jgi:hypothetical protein
MPKAHGSWIEISQDLFVHPVKDQASDPSNTRDLYAVLDNMERLGRPEVIPEGSKHHGRLGHWR